MKYFTTTVAMFISALLCTAVMATDISGKWTSEFDSGIGPQKYVYDFKIDGESLTGNAHGEVDGQAADTKITEGKVTGDKISFVENLKRDDQEIRIEYTGKMVDNEIKFTRKVADFATEEIVLKRMQPSTQPATQPSEMK